MADTQLLNQVNALLAADEQVNGKKALYSDALAVLREGNITLPLLAESADSTFFWDRETNRFILLKMQSAPLTKADFSGKKIIIYGDSITYGVGASDRTTKRFASLLQNALGATVDNRGKSGFCITTGATENKNGDPAKSHYENVVSCKDACDYLIVALGVNDWTRSNMGNTVRLGEPGSTDPTTIYGAYHTAMSALLQNYKDTDTKIIFATPTPTNWLLPTSGSGYKYSDFGSVTKNDNGYTLNDIVYAIMETGKALGVPVVNMHDLCGVTDDASSKSFSLDGLHPKDTGHQKLAELWEAYLLKNLSY